MVLQLMWNMGSTNYHQSGGTLMRPSIGSLVLYMYSNGYVQIQDVRVYKGVAKYKGGFDVPKPYTPVGFERVGDRFLILVRITLLL